MTETLTDEERREIQVATADRDVRFKALRIIDAHAAGRAALVAQLEAAKVQIATLQADGCFYRNQEQELTRERDEARDEYKQAATAYKQVCAELNETESEVARLTKELAAAKLHAGRQADARVAAEAQVAELTRERDDWKAHCMASDELGSCFQERVVKAESEVTRLNEALAAAEQRRVQAIRACDERESALQAAEARVRELTEARTRANALLRDLTDCRDFGEFLNEHLPRIERFLSGTSDTIPRI